MRNLIVDRLGTRARFLIGGAINTAGTYVVYLGLRLAIDYQWAFLIAYVLGIAFSYFFNAYVVFRTRPTWTSAASFPIVYVVQYAASALLLLVLVERLRLDERFAPLLVTIAMVPVTYLLTKFIFRTAVKEPLQ